MSSPEVTRYPRVPALAQTLCGSLGLPSPATRQELTESVHRCVEMLIKEQMRKYKMKMEEINQLEAAESIAFRRLSLLRQNAVSAGLGAGPCVAGQGFRP